MKIEFQCKFISQVPEAPSTVATEKYEEQKFKAPTNPSNYEKPDIEAPKYEV